MLGEGYQYAMKGRYSRLPEGVDEFVALVDVFVELRLAFFGGALLEREGDLDETADEVLTLDEVIGLTLLLQVEQHLDFDIMAVLH